MARHYAFRSASPARLIDTSHPSITESPGEAAISITESPGEASNQHHRITGRGQQSASPNHRERPHLTSTQHRTNGRGDNRHPLRITGEMPSPYMRHITEPTGEVRHQHTGEVTSLGRHRPKRGRGKTRALWKDKSKSEG
jgi:hypothetical protein